MSCNNGTVVAGYLPNKRNKVSLLYTHDIYDLCKFVNCRIGIDFKFQPVHVSLTFLPENEMSVTSVSQNISTTFKVSTTFHSGLMGPNWTNIWTDRPTDSTIP